MSRRWTTRCCSAIALTLLCTARAAAQQDDDDAPVIVDPTTAITARPSAVRTPPAKSENRFSPFPPQTRWTLALNNALVTEPVFDGTNAYFAIDGDRIVAYDLDAGTERWLVSLRPKSRPAIGDDLLFVAAENAVVALRLEDGSTAWEAPVTDRLAAPLAWENGWLVGATATSLLALRAADGAVMWHRDLPSAASAAPAIASNQIYVPLEDGRVLAFALEDGHDVWTRRLGDAPHRIYVVGGRLFVGSRDDFFYCLSTKDGQIQWRWRTGADVTSAPVADEHRIYFVSFDNVLRALNQRNGVQQWKRALTFRPEWGPIKGADTVIISGLGGPIRAFYMKNGAPAGELTIDTGAEVAAQPHSVELPAALGPVIVTVTRSLESGATVTASSRSVEPPMLKTFTPLPGLSSVTVPTVR